MPLKETLRTREVVGESGRTLANSITIEVRDREGVIALLNEYGVDVDFIVHRVQGSPSLSLTISPTKAGQE